jgi:hypothetical protein
LLVLWCAGGSCHMVDSDEDRDRSRRPGAEDRNGRTGRILGGRTIERSGDTVCGLDRARGDERTDFLVEAQKLGQRFVSGLASKPLEWFFRFDFKTGGDSFLQFGHKTGGDGFS